jgi:hypothetical protein
MEKKMAVRALTVCTFISLLVGGIAVAGQPGDTSGPAAGKNVEPSTAVQKDESRSTTGGQDPRGSANAAGALGVEGKPGSESGAVPQNRMAPNSGE